jgi:hypothetical protein
MNILQEYINRENQEITKDNITECLTLQNHKEFDIKDFQPKYKGVIKK